VTFLLDTNVISEPRRRRPDKHVLAWLRAADTQSLYISVLTLGELTKGAARIARRDPGQGARLQEWVDSTRMEYASRIIPVDIDIANAWAQIDAIRPLPVVDGLLAATALVRGLILVTRDTRDIAGTGVTTLNPWEA
jgi:predicted nucleic acid-binding protein